MRIRRSSNTGDEEILADDEAAPAPDDDDLDLDPSAMRRTEPLYGYVVAIELITVAILNITLTHGKGAPKHPDTTLSVIGLVASIVFALLLRTKKRTPVAFSAIVAAFFVTLPKVPDRLSLYHVFGLVIPAIYTIVLATRQRRAEKARMASGRQRSVPSRRDGPAGRRSRGAAATPSGPTPNRRYTPPKPKRRTPGRT